MGKYAKGRGGRGMNRREGEGRGGVGGEREVLERK